MTISTHELYARILADLEGDEFQNEVCARLCTVNISFQPIPASPNGDGGLDGCSHSGTRGYCCYGQQHKAARSNRERDRAIIDKFSHDLLRLLELIQKGSKLVHDHNATLRNLLAGRKLQHITLLSNWFDSNRVIGPLNGNFERYKEASHCECVERGATLTILGPKELANQHAVDQLSIERAQQRIFVKKVKAAAENVAIANPKDFDYKIRLLKEIRPERTQSIDLLAENWLADWRTALAFERELDESLPDLHRSFEQARSQIVTRVSILMLSSDAPHTKIEEVNKLAEEILQTHFGTRYNELLPQLSSGLMARMIGECPFGWDKPRAADVDK